MTNPRLRLGLDLGTSSVKAVALDATGRSVASGTSSYPTVSDLPGQAEQDPADWLTAAGLAVAEAGRGLAAAFGPGWRQAIAGIGLTGQLPTLVRLGHSGPIGPAIAWCDSRADTWAASRINPNLRARLYQATGMPIDGRYLAPMYQFHRRQEANDRAQDGVTSVLSAKDYLCFALTGRRITDPSTAAGYGTFALATGDWDTELCAVWGLDPALLPEIGAATAIAGPLHAAGARLLGLPAGIPVATGAADSASGALAMCGLAHDSAAIVMGSSTIIFAASSAPGLDPKARYLLTPHAVAGWYGREMDLLATGTGFGWLGHLLGRSGHDLEQAALSAAVGAGGVSFAPYLAGGEQGALWNPHLSGVIHGLNLSHGAAQIARAYFEGIFFEIRRCLDVLEETTPMARVVLAGHAVANPGLVALLADVLHRPVQAYIHTMPSAIGAAMQVGRDVAPVMARADQNGPDQTGQDQTVLKRTQTRPAKIGPAQIGPFQIGPVQSGPDETAPGPDAMAYDLLYRRHLALFPKIADAAQP